MTKPLDIDQLMTLVFKHSHANDSAQLCARDAVELILRGKDEDARDRAVDSLRHSVGVFHPDYKVAIAK